MNPEKIGNFLKECRKKNNITQNEVADGLNLTRENISKWERGITIPGSEYLKKLSEILGVTVSEILAGEYAVDKDAQSNQVICDIIDENKMRRKKMLISFGIIIFVLLFLFFLYYFINNYNSIKVYRISGTSDNFEINESILVVSKEKVYLNFNEIESYNEDIKLMRLYYLQNGEERIIKESNKLSGMIIDDDGYAEYLSYDNVKYIIDSLYLKIITINNYEEIIKLSVKKDYSNDYFNDVSKEIISNSTKQEFNYKIKDKYLKKFKYNEGLKTYIYNYKNNKKEFSASFNKESNSIVVSEEDNNLFKEWRFFSGENLSYFENKKMIFCVNILESGILNDKYKNDISYFKENYLNKYFEKQ